MEDLLQASQDFSEGTLPYPGGGKKWAHADKKEWLDRTPSLKRVCRSI